MLPQFSASGIVVVLRKMHKEQLVSKAEIAAFTEALSSHQKAVRKYLLLCNFVRSLYPWYWFNA
jgi:hypothetical protein